MHAWHAFPFGRTVSPRGAWVAHADAPAKDRPARTRRPACVRGDDEPVVMGTRSPLRRMVCTVRILVVVGAQVKRHNPRLEEGLGGDKRLEARSEEARPGMRSVRACRPWPAGILGGDDHPTRGTALVRMRRPMRPRSTSGDGGDAPGSHGAVGPVQIRAPRFPRQLSQRGSAAREIGDGAPVVFPQPGPAERNTTGVVRDRRGLALGRRSRALARGR